MLGVEINRFGIEPLVHLTCKDKNRNALESLLYGLERASIRNLLVMTGDYPKDGGFLGTAKPVFDLDPITLLGLISELNNGKEISTPKGTTVFQPTHFFPGVAASPFKAVEAEQMGQYYKLHKKLRAGARFVVSQLGFDIRKFHELLQIVNSLGFGNIPVVGNIYLVTYGVAKIMHSNALPGCVVTDKLLAEIKADAAAADKGKSKRLDRGAKLYALLKGMGFAGAHISGPGMTYDDLEYVIEKGEELAPNWPDFVRDFDYPQKDGWYFFGKDEHTGLNGSAPAAMNGNSHSVLLYHAFRAVHHAMFTKRGLFFPPMQSLCKAIDGSRFEGTFAKFEKVVKGITNDCLHCGDCAMSDIAYLCPQSQCAKNQRNGPCGGSYGGWCEKYPNERKCIHVRAYELLKGHGAEDSLGIFQNPPIYFDLYQTSSWINFYLGRDHAAGPQGIPQVPRSTGAKESKACCTSNSAKDSNAAD